MATLTILFLLVIAVLLWQAGMRCRAIAIDTARNVCASHGLQFLDGTTSLRQMRPYYTRDSGAGIRRIYWFDYSGDGFDRQSGCIIMDNARVNAVLLDE